MADLNDYNILNNLMYSNVKGVGRGSNYLTKIVKKLTKSRRILPLL